MAAHVRCAGNPIDDKTHHEQVHKAIERIKGWNLYSLGVHGLFVTDRGCEHLAALVNEEWPAFAAA